MKFPSLFAVSLLAGHVSAYHGTLGASPYYEPSPGYVYQEIYLVDSQTGSTYTGDLYGGFDGCTSSQCYVNFRETSPGGYNFGALVWRTSDGCHNIDFKGALDSGHGYCCGILPCNIVS